MARGLNHAKLDVWRERLARFTASGLTVASFCRQEDVGQARFYYWKRRVREAESAGESLARRWRPKAAPLVARQQDPSKCVEVLIGEQVKLRLPADDFDLITCVLESLGQSVHAVAAGGFLKIDQGPSEACVR